MNVLSREKQITIISALVEESSVRSVERMTRVHRDTIIRLMVRVGEHCQRIMSERMQGLRCEAIEADEIWSYVGKKQKHLTPDDPHEFGDTYVFVAMDPKTKLIPCFTVGKRSEETTHVFASDLSRRIDGRVQISTDGWAHYRRAIPQHFGDRADFCQIIKNYGDDPDEHRYSPGRIRSIEHVWVQGFPDTDRVSTSRVERQNLTMRMAIRRFTRLTNAFSKRLVNLKAAVALHFAWYNFARVHGTLRVTPAMAAGIVGTVWTIADLLPN